jgi:hypothetical protein
MPVKPAPASFFRSVVESNPFYLASACCMLAGCLAVTNSLSWWGIPTSRLLTLFATLNLYEAALIGLAAYLVLVRGLRRDGILLVILEAFFLIDITFLNAEITTQRSWIGPALAIFSFAAAIVKLAVILRILGIRRSAPEFSFVLIQIGLILAFPLVFSRNTGGVVSPRTFYIAWWIVGMMPAVYEFLVKFLRTDEPRLAPTRAMLTYMVLPWLSLAAHLGILHYVYDVPFYGAMAAPALLMLAMVLNHIIPEGVMPRYDIVALRVLLPLAAILVSASSPGELTLFFGRSGHLAMTTLRLTVVLSYLELMYSFFREYWVFSSVAGIICLLIVAYGPSANQIGTSAHGFWDWLTPIAWDVIPTSQTGCGALLVVAAFIFLALGAAVSLRRPIPPANPD